MYRRQFLRSLPLAAAAISSAGLGRAAEDWPLGEPHMKRFDDQRWFVENSGRVQKTPLA